MDNNIRIVALVLAAGHSRRFGANIPKQYLPLLGKPVLRWSLERLSRHAMISSVHTVIQPQHKALYENSASGLRLGHSLLGGATRQESVRLALEMIEADYVLIHDAARPCLSGRMVTELCHAVQAYGAAIPVLPVTDTLRRITATGSATQARNDLYTVQTPQTFSLSILRGLHSRFAHQSFTDDASLFDAASLPVEAISGDRMNIKITEADDLLIAQQYLSTRAAEETEETCSTNSNLA